MTNGPAILIALNHHEELVVAWVGEEIPMIPVQMHPHMAKCLAHPGASVAQDRWVSMVGARSIHSVGLNFRLLPQKGHGARS